MSKHSFLFSSYDDIVNYLRNKQVYFSIEIADSNLRTIAEPFKVHHVGDVEVKRLNDRQILFSFTVNGTDANLYLDYNEDSCFFEFVKANFISVCELVELWHSTLKRQSITVRWGIESTKLN